MTETVRRSGVLLHVSSLPGDYGCGSFGREALAFIDKIADAGFSLWQTLPFSMPDDFGSPYKSPSAFLSNPYFIDLPTLAAEGLLTIDELAAARQKTPYATEFARLRTERLPLLARAASRLSDEKRAAVLRFAETVPQVADACRWAAEHLPAVADCGDGFFFRLFCEYEFDREWQTVRAHAKKRGVRIVGDIPFYVDGGADVALYPDLFSDDAVAGCPPDAFSSDGQLWGNPLYNWDAMARDGYAWWRGRIAHCFRYFDVLRIDHFRAIEAYWKIPKNADKASAGRWVDGPRMPFVRAICDAAGEGEIVAEDLGTYTPGLTAFMKESRLPGMKILQFASYSGDPSDPYMPYNYPENCVAYTGTHDNNTLLGWAFELPPETRRNAFACCGYDGDDIGAGCRAMIRTLFQSHAKTVVLPLQDLLLYGRDTRMNTPGVATGNWTYRATAEALLQVDVAFFRRLNRLAGR